MPLTEGLRQASAAYSHRLRDLITACLPRLFVITIAIVRQALDYEAIALFLRGIKAVYRRHRLDDLAIACSKDLVRVEDILLAPSDMQ